MPALAALPAAAGVNLLNEFLAFMPLPPGNPVAPVIGLLMPAEPGSIGMAAVLGLPAEPIGAVPILLPVGIFFDVYSPICYRPLALGILPRVFTSGYLPFFRMVVTGLP